jgi:hypothetical protein
MFNNSTAFTMPVVPAQYGYGNNGGMFGNGSDWWGIIILLALLGWGGNGFGGFGGFGGGRGFDFGCNPCATQADVRAAVDQQTLISKLDQQTYGLADSTYALNNTITSGFHGVDNAICNLGYNVQQGFNTLGHQISDCCCATQRAIDGVNYNLATQSCDTRNLIQNTTRDIIDSQNAGTRAILDFLTTDKISSLQAENQALKFKASQAEQNTFITANQQAQTAELIRRLGADCPVNAYVVQPPTPVTFPVNCCGQFNGYSGYNSCGCGCA